MVKGRKILFSNAKGTQHLDRWWVDIDGSVYGGEGFNGVPLQKSREVRLEPHIRRIRRPNVGKRHLVLSARTGKVTGGVSRSGIQNYRHWFQFLKLALELESLGDNVLLVTRQGWKETSRFKRATGTGVGKITNYGTAKFHTRSTVRVLVNRKKYGGWDLDEVLNDPFDKWWKSHSHLFEGNPVRFMKHGSNLDLDDLHISIPKTSKLEDIKTFIIKEVQHQLTGKPRFRIDGHPRPDILQNRYNALVLTLKGMGPKEICEGGPKKHIYLRSTDSRSKGDRLKVPSHTNPNTRIKKFQHGNLVGKQRNGGLHHLQDVIKGKFGDVPKKGIEKGIER